MLSHKAHFLVSDTSEVKFSFMDVASGLQIGRLYISFDRGKPILSRRCYDASERNTFPKMNL